MRSRVRGLRGGTFLGTSRVKPFKNPEKDPKTGLLPIEAIKETFKKNKLEAFCGPVSFIGLAVPHIARLMLGTSNHNSLLPVTLLTGSSIALLCNLICILPGESGIIPLNAVTPVLGAPVVIYVIINQRRIQYFN